MSIDVAPPAPRAERASPIPPPTRRIGDEGGWRRLLDTDGVRIHLPLLIAIAVVAIYANSQNSNFLSTANVQNIAIQISVLAIIAIGQTFLLAAGQLDLSVGSMASLTGVLAATWLAGGAGSEPVVVAACILIGAGIGAVWALLVTGLRLPPFILTLGGLAILSSLALRVAGDRPVPMSGRLGWLRTGDLFGIRWPIVLSVTVVVVAAVILRFSRFGRLVYAVGSSEDAARLAGLPVRRIQITVFVISGALVGLAGVILAARIGAGDPRAGQGLELRAIAAVVLGGATLAGGRGSALGTFIAVILLGVIQSALNFTNINSSYEGLVFGGVLVLAITLTALADRRRAGQAVRSRRTPSTGAGAATPGALSAEPAPGVAASPPPEEGRNTHLDPSTEPALDTSDPRPADPK